MRKSDFIYTAVLLPIDYLMLLLAGYISYYLRTTPFIRDLDVISTTFYAVSPSNLTFFIMSMAFVWILFYRFAGLYSPYENRKFINQITRVFLASTAGIAAVIVFLFFKREFLLSSRFIILAGWMLSILLVIIARGIVRIIRRFLLKFSFTSLRTIVVGADANTQKLIEQLQKNSVWGYKVIGKVLTIDQLSRKLEKIHCDEVILADVGYSREKIHEFLTYCQTMHLDFKYTPDIFAAELHNVEMDAIAGFPLLEIKRTPLEGWGRFKKRILDIGISAFAIVISFVPSLIIAVLIKITSLGPVFARLTRVGEGGTQFKIYKFRSMIDGAEDLKDDLIDQNERKGPLFKLKRDPRITPLGRVLRRFSIDELPNFVNVLMGQMSLVGPRPHEPGEVVRYKEYQKKLLNIKPGITGVAQISGRSNLDFDEEARLDLYYVENWSLKTDIAILLKTPFVVMFRRNEAT